MRPRNLLSLCICIFLLSATADAQILKKIKDKVNKTIDKEINGKSEQADETKDSDSKETENNRSISEKAENEKSVRWCDTIEVTGAGGGAGKDGVSYEVAYTGQGRVDVLYDESALGINSDGSGYRIILSEKADNKLQYKVVENGKVIHTDTKINTKYISKSTSYNTVNDQGGESQNALSKYIVGDTMKHNIPKTEASTATIEKIEDDQFEAALEMARQTDDYKNMSDAEKKEFEENMRTGLAKHNSMAGTKIPVAGQAGGDVALVNGYFVVIKGKKYGKFLMPPAVDVSPDETRFLAVGVDEKNGPVMIVNGKKTSLDKNKFAGIGGRIIKSPDQKKSVYIEQKKMSDKEIEDLSNAAANNQRTKLIYNVIRSDGSSLSVTDHNYSGKFKLTNSGAVVIVNEESGEVFADNKSIGKFALKNGDRLDADAVLLGNDISQVAYYNGSEGSLTYLDGSVKKMDIMFPRVVTRNGKSQLSWFRKCRNTIYIASFAY